MEYVYISCSSYESRFWKTAQNVEKILMSTLLLLSNHDTYMDNGICVPEGVVYLSRKDICKRASVDGVLRREFERLEEKYGLIETSLVNKKTYIKIKDFSSCRNKNGGYSFGLPGIPGQDDIDDIGFIEKSYPESKVLKLAEPIVCAKTIIIRTQYVGFLSKKHYKDYLEITRPLSENPEKWHVEQQNPTNWHKSCHYFRTVNGHYVGNIEDMLSLFSDGFPDGGENVDEILHKLPFFWQFGTTFATPFFFQNLLPVGGLQDKNFLNPDGFPDGKTKMWFILPEISSYSPLFHVFYRTDNIHLFSDLYDICPDLIGKNVHKKDSSKKNDHKRTITHPLNVRKIYPTSIGGECFKFYNSTLDKRAWFAGSSGQRITMLTMLMCTPLQERFSVNKDGVARTVSGELSMSYMDIARVAHGGMSKSKVWHYVNALAHVGFCKKIMSSGSSAILITNWIKYQMIFEMYDISLPINGLILSDYSFNLWLGRKKTAITRYIYLYYISTCL